MSIIQRSKNLAAGILSDKQGGDSTGIAIGAPIGQKWNHPEDPAADLLSAARFVGVTPDLVAANERFAGSALDPARRKVLGPFSGIFAFDYAGANLPERHFLNQLLDLPFAQAAYATNLSLHLLRCPYLLRRSLTVGCGLRYAQKYNVPLLNAAQARWAAYTFHMLGMESRAQLWSALVQAGTHDGQAVLHADKYAERSMILKALAARRHLLHPGAFAGKQAMAEVLQFATDIRGLARYKLLAMLIPSPTDVLVADEERPVTALKAICNMDPITAMQNRGQNSDLDELTITKSATIEVQEGKQQWLAPEPLNERTRIHRLISLEQKRSEKRTAHERLMVLRDCVSGRTLAGGRQLLVKAAQKSIERYMFEAPSMELLDELRYDALNEQSYDATNAASYLFSAFTSGSYLRRSWHDQIAAGFNPVEQIKSACKQGFVVPVVCHHKITKVPEVVFAHRVRKIGQQHLLLLSTTEGKQAEIEQDRLVAGDFGALLDISKNQTAAAYLLPVALELADGPLGVDLELLSDNGEAIHNRYWDKGALKQDLADKVLGLAEQALQAGLDPWSMHMFAEYLAHMSVQVGPDGGYAHLQERKLVATIIPDSKLAAFTDIHSYCEQATTKHELEALALWCIDIAEQMSLSGIGRSLADMEVTADARAESARSVGLARHLKG